MQCPICGSDRKAEYKKCPTCGVNFADWLSKVIKKLNKKTNKVMVHAKKSQKTEDGEKKPAKYKEIIKQQ